MKRVFFCLGVILLSSLIAASSAIEGKIAFIREGNIWLADADGTNQRRLSSDGNFTSPSWSPDGEYIVCERHFETSKDRWQHSVWLIDVEKVQAKRLTPDYSTDYIEEDLDSTFSSDGRYVIYVKRGSLRYPESESLGLEELERRSGEATDYLVAIDLQAGKEIVLASSGCGWEGATFCNPQSIDGIKDIVYTEGGEGITSFIRLQSGYDPSYIIKGGEGYQEAAISHNREYIASVRDMWEEDRSELCVIRIENKDMRVFRLPEKAFYSTSIPSFSPDNRYIILGEHREGKDNIRIVDLESGEKRLLIENADEATWSPR